MIKEISFQNWKSFKEAKLYIDPLTVLIGMNAGGKSNALDSLRLLQRIASGVDLTSAIKGDAGLPGIRGGVEWAALKPEKSFKLSVLVEGQERTDYEYSISIDTGNQCKIQSESLRRIKYRQRSKNNPYQIQLFGTDEVEDDDPSITARLYNEKRGTPKQLGRSTSVLSQLVNTPLRDEIEEGIQCVANQLRSIFVFDPIPSHMRSYSPLSDSLQTDASNIAGVIAALNERGKKGVEDTLTQYAQHIPEGDISRIWAEPVGKFGSDAMLYCEEQWSTGAEPEIVDARGMSDGTLRFLAILAALLTRPKGSFLVIEEVDNGLHPSRVGLLLDMLRQEGQRRNIDVLVTTHNPALLDALGPELLPFVVIAHRDPETGYSALTLFEEIEKYPKLLAFGSLGQLSAEGRIQRALAS